MDAHWQRCIDAFLQSIEDISGSTRSRVRYAHVLRTFFSDDRNPDTYTRAEVQEYLSRKSISPRNYGADVTPSTRNNRLMALSSFYKFAASYEVNGAPLLQSESPTSGLKYLRVGSSPRSMSTDDLERLFAIIPHDTLKGVRDHALLLTYFWTGRRRSEIARLLWRDIEHAVIVEPDGTRRPGVLYRYIAKGHSRETKLAELPPLAWATIERYLDQSGRLNNMIPDSPLFASTRPDQPEQQLTGDYINSEMKRYCKLAGLNPAYTLHCLRHTAARERYSAGSKIEDIRDFLGHSSLATTELYLKRVSGIADTGATLLTQRFGKL